MKAIHQLQFAALLLATVLCTNASDEPKPVATQAPVPAQTTAEQPARWEYRHTVSMRDGMPEEDVMMNILGDKGWELVSVNLVPGRTGAIWHYTFKRLKK